MEENKKEFPLAGWIAVLVALVVGVVLIFAMLEMVMPKQWSAQIWDEMTVEKVGEEYRVHLFFQAESIKKFNVLR